MDGRRLHGVCVALALVCSLVCASAAWGVYAKDYVEPKDFNSGIRDRVEVNEGVGGLTLMRSLGIIPFLWVPSPSEGIVSKVDARTGLETARYAVGPKGENWAPCAVACDLQGNAYVACSVQNSAGRIVRIAASEGADRNKDGVIITSSDLDANFRITPSETLTWGADEKVTVFAEVGDIGSAPSALLFDSNGYLWVALWGEGSLVKLDPRTGDQIATVLISARPSALVVGEKGTIWVLSRDNRVLCAVDSITCTVSESYDLGECSPGGICMDRQGKLWIGDYSGGLIGLQTRSGVWSRHTTTDEAGYAGVAVDAHGDIWAACPQNNTVAHFSGEDGSLIAAVPVGKRPDSVSVDEDGYVWTLNFSGNTATRVNARDNKAELTASICAKPYSSSSFTAFVTYKGTSPVGNWHTIANSGIPGGGWGTVTWKKSGIGHVSVYVRAANTLAELEAQEFIEVRNSETFDTLRGQYLELWAAMEGDGAAGPVLHALHIEGINLAPEVKNASATLARIYSTSREMEPVGIAGIVDPEGDPVTITITKVTQDEPVTGLTEEDEGPDATGIGGKFVLLRGERDYGTHEQPGNGRVYTVHFKATDCWGASSTGKVEVTVPPGTLPRDVAVNDGQNYDSVADQNSLQKHEQVAQVAAQ